MLVFPANLLVLGALPFFADAAHHHHSHRISTGSWLAFSLPANGPFASGSKALASASNNIPYPVGNDTFAGASGTATAFIRTTIISALQHTVYATLTGTLEPSQTATELGGQGGEASSASAAVVAASLGAPDGLHGAVSYCEAAVTVTVTNPITITSTLVPTSSTSSLDSPSSSSAQPSHQSEQSSIPPSTANSALSTAPVATEAQVASDPPASSITIAQKYTSQLTVSASAKPSSPAEPSSSQLAAHTSSIASPAASSSSNNLTPNGIKAGVAGYRSITEKSSWSQFTPHIGWYSDYWPDTPDSGSVTGIGMLWGDGHQGGDDASRLSTFKSLSTTPKYMMGFYEPDFHAPDSSEISSTSAATSWSSLIAPLGQKGSLLGSPSLATQKDESWLTPFEDAPEHPTWDYTCIHTNKPTVTGVQEDVEYYLAKYKKPIWVSEFACVDDQSWTPCTDAQQIKTFIQDVVAFLQGNESVVAYGYSNGNGLGNVWPMIDSSGAITASGQVYLDTISAL